LRRTLSRETENVTGGWGKWQIEDPFILYSFAIYYCDDQIGRDRKEAGGGLTPIGYLKDICHCTAKEIFLTGRNGREYLGADGILKWILNR
jgi:hypothetical protein